jgi:hypothetical protein
MNTSEDNTECVGRRWSVWWKYGNNSYYLQLQCACQYLCFIRQPIHPTSSNVVGKVVTERTIFVLDNGKLNRGYCGTFVPVE